MSKALIPFHSIILSLLQVLRWLIYAFRQSQIKLSILTVNTALLGKEQVEHKEQKSNIKLPNLAYTFCWKMSAVGSTSCQTNTSSEILSNGHLSACASIALLISRKLSKIWMVWFTELLLI